MMFMMLALWAHGTTLQPSISRTDLLRALRMMCMMLAVAVVVVVVL